MSTAFVGGLVHGHPRTTAVLVEGGSIAAIGSDDLARTADDVIELRGRPLLPGFQDSHVHPPLAGLELVAYHLLETPHTEQAYLDEIRP